MHSTSRFSPSGSASWPLRFLERSHFKRADASNPVIDEFPDAVDVQTGEVIEESAGLQTNNPGFPGFEHGAWVFSSFLNLTLGALKMGHPTVLISMTLLGALFLGCGADTEQQRYLKLWKAPRRLIRRKQ